MASIANISGVALAPGVSRNRRLYTPELIMKAAKRMQERLADPNGLPIVMRTHHEAGDDSAKIVGRVTEVTVDNDKNLRYKADLYDTFHGREIANLVTPKNPALRSVSIHGYWMGDPKQVSYEGGMATTADDLEIDAIDFTASPGIQRALIDGDGQAKESADGFRRTPISESSEASVTLLEEGSGWADISHTMTEEGVAMTRGDVGETRYWVVEAKYSADDMRGLLAKGHAMKNTSGEPSYPIADVSDLKKAIKAVGRGKGSHDAIRRHIIKRAKALGQSGLIPDNWASDGSMKESAPVRLSDIKEYYPEGPSGSAGFCIDAYAGPLSVTVRGCVAPDELRFAAQRAAMAALDAILTMDPDQDGDLADADDFDDQGNFLGDQDEEPGMETVTVNVSGQVLGERELRDLVARMVKDLRAEESATTEVAAVAEAGAGAGAVSKDDDMESASGGHSHTHAMGEAATHTHGHVHTHETAGGGSYDHSHGHTHFHLPGADEAHTHGHDHDHSTAAGDTHEHASEKESAVSETEVKTAAEAAPNRTLTPEDLNALGETIGNALAEALRAVAEMNAPKHAATTQETTESAAEVTAAESTTQKAEVDVAALKESLAKELRKEIRDQLRADLLEEKGLPARRGYRLTESDEPEELTDAELFNKHRVDILLGAYAATPSPDQAAS